MVNRISTWWNLEIRMIYSLTPEVNWHAKMLEMFSQEILPIIISTIFCTASSKNVSILLIIFLIVLESGFRMFSWVYILILFR